MLFFSFHYPSLFLIWLYQKRMGLHYLSASGDYGEFQLIRTGLKRGIYLEDPVGSSMQVLIHAFHRVTLLHNNVHHDGFWYLRHRYPLRLEGDMDNTPLLQIGFDGHFVVYRRGLGVSNDPRLPGIWRNLWILCDITGSRRRGSIAILSQFGLLRRRLFNIPIWIKNKTSIEY